jgi:MFS family permease
MYIMARAILGFGIAPCIVSASALLGELGYPKERPILGSLFNSSYFIGALAAAGLVFGTSKIPSEWSWRLPSLLQAVPSLFQVALIFFVPESPRYLISKDRREEAYEILVKYHGEGDRNNVIVHAEFAQMEETIKLEMETNKLSWLDLVRTRGNQKRILVGSLLGLFTQWSGNTLISYYLSTILEQIGYTDTYTNQKINVGNVAWQLINATFFALIVNKFARRKMYLACACSLLCCYIGWTIANARYAVTGSLAAGKLVIFFIFLYSPCYNLGYNALTYSKPPNTSTSETTANIHFSLPRRAVPIRHPISRHFRLPVLGTCRWSLQHIRQSHWYG